MEARNSFEAYIFSLKHTLDEQGFQARLPTPPLTPTLTLTLTLRLTLRLTPRPSL